MTDMGGTAVPAVNTTTLVLPWDKPQLNPNKRWHWAKRARVTAEVRQTAAWLAVNSPPTRLAKRGRLAWPVTVTLHYRPRQRRVRDAVNLTMDHKACVDGLRDAGMLPDDNPEYLDERMPVLHPPGKPARMWLEIEWSERQ